MPSSLATALLGALLLVPAVRALDVDWTIPSDRQPYAPVAATVGATVRFAYDPGHNVYLHPSGTCDAAGGTFVGNASPTDYTFARAGTYTFACDVSGGAHCGLGQIINITVTDDTAPLNENEDGGKDPSDGEGAAVPVASTAEESPEEVLARHAEFFNPGEEQGMMEFRIQPYEVPREVTTYTDFLFNFPEDLGDIVHVVVGEVIVTQPRHLHHFVLSGCTERVDPAREGRPADDVPEDCVVPLGIWAVGGDLYGGLSLDSGVAFGRGLGVRALSLNVHYTDGQSIDTDYPHVGTRALATDGLRILYTPDLRRRTVLYKPLINIGFGPDEMNVPPGQPRYFYTKTCTVEPACQDTSATRMVNMGQDYTCEEVEGDCEAGEREIFCPVACGVCVEGAEGSEPDGYEINAVNYHAHLLGREMYATLLPNARSADPVDLESKDVWIYDYQVTYPFRDDEGDNAALQVYPGDKIQATCVYDSTSRDTPTPMFASTYEEMCITQLHVRIDTPAAGDDGSGSLLARLNSKSFTCVVDDDSDIWRGSLAADEDGRDIWKDHPMLDADCTFPVGSWWGAAISLTGDTVPTWEVHCSGSGDENVAGGVCDLCPGGLAVDDDTDVPGSEGETCGSLEDFAASMPSQSSFCLLIQQARALCCPAAVSGDREPTDTITDTSATAPAENPDPDIVVSDPESGAADQGAADATVDNTTDSPSGNPEPTDAITDTTPAAPAENPDPDADISDSDNGAAAVGWATTSVPTVAMAWVVLFA